MVSRNFERDKKIVEMWLAGASLRDIEKEFGISFQRVQAILEKAGCKVIRVLEAK